MQEKNIIAELGFYLAREADIEVGRGVRGNLVWLGRPSTPHNEKGIQYE